MAKPSMYPARHSSCPRANSSETKPCTDQCSATHYSRPKISNLPQFTSMHSKSKKKTTVVNTGLLAYTFIKFGDNLTNKDRDILTDISNSV